jgi:hypothetical protein
VNPFRESLQGMPPQKGYKQLRKDDASIIENEL